jgi:hypothetical protein
MIKLKAIKRAKLKAAQLELERVFMILIINVLSIKSLFTT